MHRTRIAALTTLLLLALPGMTEGLVDRFLQFRRGPDGLDGTNDDAPFQNLDDVRAALGFSPQQFSQIVGSQKQISN